MSTTTFSQSQFEDFPDEILLLICRYLSSTEILYSLNNLNYRLTQTISDYHRRVVLGQVPFQRFNFICRSILPRIGSHIRVLVISNDWKGVLSNVFLQYFSDRMSVTFPNVERIVLTTFVIDSLMTFLSSLRDLPHFSQLKISSLYEMSVSSTSRDVLLRTIFDTNNCRLKSITFDDDCLDFTYENHFVDFIYPHLTKLVIQLTNLNDLHKLLCCFPQLEYLDVEINNEGTELDENLSLNSIFTVKYFCLRSLLYSWTFDELISIFKRIPNVEQVKIQIGTNDDVNLIHGKELSTYLSNFSLKNFSYFLQIGDVYFANTTKIVSTWKNQFPQDFLCIQSEDEESLMIYSLPFSCPYLILRCSVAKNPIFVSHFATNVKCLTLYEVSPRIVEVFPIIVQCRRMQCLVLQVTRTDVPKSLKEISLRKMPSLTFFVCLQQYPINTDDFMKLLESSPNLYHFALNYEVIRPFLNIKNLCDLLGQRLTDLLIGITTNFDSESLNTFVTRLASVFPSLRHLYFHFKEDTLPVESLIITICTNLFQWKRLISFGIANIQLNSTILSKGLRQWLLENSNLPADDSFLTDYSAKTFRLWL